MQRINSPLFLLFAVAILIGSCEKKEDFLSDAPADYLQLKVGKWIRYKYDSTVFFFYGQKDTVMKYQAKDVVEDSLLDNAGRKAWRIVRYLSDSTGTQPWKPITTLMVVPSRESVEWVENNFRYLKLKLPIIQGFSWKGNSFIDTYSLNSEVRYMDDWDYKYANVNQDFLNFNAVKLPGTVTVEQRDELIGTPSNINVYSEKTYAKEVWAKGTGLVFKEFIHWEYQPPAGNNPGYKSGYGLKMQMIDHN